MRDAENVITDAVNGYTGELAQLFEVSEPRMYQLLSTHCSYPRTKRLIRAIGSINQDGARLIKADMDALFVEVLGDVSPTTLAERHRELGQALQADIEELPKAEQLKEWRDVLALAARRIGEINNNGYHVDTSVREHIKTIPAVKARTNNRG